MKFIIELVHLLPPQKTSQIEVISSDINKQSKLGRLYYGILDGSITDDTKAAQLLYNKSPDHPAFVKLKYRLQERLLNTLFLVDVNQPKYTDYGNAIFNSFQSFALIKILLTKSARKTAIYLAENLLEHSKKYEITELNFMLTTDLRNHYSNLQLNRNKFIKYNILNKKFQEELIAEGKAAELFNLINLNEIAIVNGKLSKKSKELITNLMEELELLNERVSTYRFLLLYHLSKTTLLELKNDYKKLPEQCKLVLKTFEKKESISNIPKYIFNLKILIAHFNLGDYEKSLLFTKKVVEFTSKGSHNWHLAKYYQATLYLHQGNYEKGFNCKQSVFKDTNINELAASLREHWLILEAYIEFLREIGKIPAGAKRFRLQKFLNEVPIYNREKRGKNISILILQLLFFLVWEDFGNYIDRMDALKQYSHRYLSSADTSRSNTFIRMMRKLPRVAFNHLRAKELNKKDFWFLKKEPKKVSNKPADIEIIPYEQLWPMVLKVLETNYSR